MLTRVTNIYDMIKQGYTAEDFLIPGLKSSVGDWKRGGVFGDRKPTKRWRLSMRAKDLIVCTDFSMADLARIGGLEVNTVRAIRRLHGRFDRASLCKLAEAGVSVDPDFLMGEDRIRHYTEEDLARLRRLKVKLVRSGCDAKQRRFGVVSGRRRRKSDVPKGGHLSIHGQAKRDMERLERLVPFPRFRHRVRVRGNVNDALKKVADACLYHGFEDFYRCVELVKAEARKEDCYRVYTLIERGPHEFYCLDWKNC